MPEDVRIVIPAYRARESIRDCVTAVSVAARHIDHEIVVVDDGGNSDLRLCLAGLPAAVVCTGGSGSAARARNRGARGFDGRVLVFIDADVIVDRDCLQRLLAPIRDGRAEATIGNYAKNVSGLDFAASYKQLYTSRIYDRRHGYVRNDFWTAISAIDAAAFRSAGEFDASFRGANGEDADLGRRLTRRNQRVLAVPEALGQHRHPQTLRKIFENDWRKGVLAMRHGLRADVALSDNRHATRRDVSAVLLALGLAGLPAVALLGGPWGALVVATPTFAAYLLARSDLLACFAAQGLTFLLRAVPLMLALDMLRAACAASGVLLRLVEQLRHREPRALNRLTPHD
jgi:GT2 family glycosyltransferase